MSKQQKLSRRQFMRLAGMTAAGTALASCAPGASAPGTDAPGTEAPETEAPPAPEPTATDRPAVSFGSSGAKHTLRYWTVLSNVDGDIMNDLVKQFTDENPDIAVESLQGIGDFIQKMQAASISDTAPEVVLMRHTYLGPFALKNMLSPIEPSEMESAGIVAEDYDPTVWNFTQFEGQQYTIPMDVHCIGLYYNTKLLADVGFNEAPKTTDEWLEAVTEVAKKDDLVGYGTFALGAGAQQYLTWFWYGVQRCFGGEMLSADGTKAAFNTPEGIAAAQWMVDMQQKGNPENADAAGLLRSGQGATFADGTWGVSLYFDEERSSAAPDVEAAVTPVYDLNNPAVWGQSHQFAIPARSNPDPELREATFKFINWMSEHSVDWAKAGQIPAHNASREEALSSDDLYLQKLAVYAEQLPYVAYMPPHPKLLEVMPRIAINVEGAIYGLISVEDALAKAEEEVNQILAEA
ncbi:MAG: extracellular solute-binding protein [Anaerolineae bacterium]|nr:extracellular solute-binding protein [Anaerolineae bacterium]